VTTRPLGRRLGVVLGAVLLLALAIPAVLVLLTGRQAQAQAATLQQAVDQATTHARQGTFDPLPADLQAIDQAASDLEATTSSWQWQVLSMVPGLGPTADAIPVVAAVTRSLAHAAQPLATTVADAPSTLALVQSLPELEPAVRQLQQAATQATADLDQATADGLRFGLADQLATAQEATTAIQDATTTALDAWPALQGLLGFDGPRTYLVMLQNPAEARGSGGLFSAFMRVTLNEGVPTIEEANSRKILDEMRIPIPDDIDPGEQQLWGDFLTKWASFNTSPDFPTTARLAQAGMQARGTPVDGVVAIDPFTVQAILAGTGPVEHKGVTIDGTTAAEFFTKGIYQDFPGFDDVDAKDELALGLLYATVDAVLNRPLDLGALADAIPTTIDEGHLSAWVPDETERQYLDELGIAKAVQSADPATPIIALNNGTGGKLDAYITTTADLQASTCTIPADPDGSNEDIAGWSQSILTVTLANEAPDGLPDYVDVRLDDEQAPRGSTKILVSVLGPPGALDDGVMTDGDFADYASGQAHGRPSWVTQLELERGQAKDMTVTYLTPPGSPAPTQAPIVASSYSPAATTLATVNTSTPCPDPVG